MISYVRTFVLIFIEALCCKFFFETFYEEKFYAKTWINKLFFIVLVLGFVIVAILPQNNYLLKAMACIGIIFIIMLIQYRRNIVQIAFMSVIYYGLIICIDSIMIIVLNYAIGVQETSILNNSVKGTNILNDPIRGTIVALLCKTVLFLCITSINRLFNGFGSFNLITDREWVRFLFFPIITIVSMSAFAMERGIASNAMLIVSSGLVLSNFLVFYMIRDVVKREKGIQEMRLSQERIKSQMDMYEFVENANKEQNKKIHEFKNHLGCLQGLLRSEKYMEAVNYINNITNNWNEEIDYVNTNNIIVNSVLNQKMKQAGGKGIPMILAFTNLSGIPMKEEDIVTILANLLDNAIEACDKISDCSKFIKIRFVDENGKVTISVRNPVGEPVKIIGDRVVSTKPNQKEHGIGMINIENAVKKYNGENIYNYNKGYFTHSIIIKYE